MNPFARPGSMRRYLIAGFVVLLTGMVFVGFWVKQQLEYLIINRVGLVTGLYVESFVSPHLQSLAASGALRDSDRSALERLLTGTPLGKEIVAFKIWAHDGRVLQSSTPALVGRRFPVKPALAAALAGEVRSHIVDLTDAENEFESGRWPQLIETYVPVRQTGTGVILAVAEFYQTTDYLEREERAAQIRILLVVSTVTLMMFLVFAWLVRRAGDTIDAQRNELSDKVTQLSDLLRKNEHLHERVARAAAHTTALNERFLRRIAADLHDGPGQGLALALLRLEELAAASDCPVGDEFRTLQSALQSSLDELRSISSGLQLPEIEGLSLAETAYRAARDYQRKTGAAVEVSVDHMPPEAPLPVKITLFRLLQETLSNGFRHAGGEKQRVTIRTHDGHLLVEVADGGNGFDPQAATAKGRLGLTGMRDRVEILGGTFSIDSTPGRGTVIRALLPLTPTTLEHE